MSLFFVSVILRSIGIEKIKKYYLFGSIFINHNNGLNGVIVIESTKGIIPVELTNEDLDFIVMYPNIINKLKAGEILYLQGFKGYIGEKGTVGPYYEDEVFNLGYFNLNSDLNELIMGLEKMLK